MMIKSRTIPSLVFMISLVASAPVLGSILVPAHADSPWDGQGQIHPAGKKIVKDLDLAHATQKPTQKAIPYYRINEIPSKLPLNQSMATIVDTQKIRAHYIPRLENTKSPFNSSSSNSSTMNGIAYDSLTPPDVQVAAGPSDVMEMVNLQGKIWDKNETVIRGPFDLTNFFGTGSDFVSDPKVLFDTQSNRWFSSITDVSTSNVLVAVSTTADPTGGYCIYNIPGPSSTILDQPIIGTSDDKLTVSVNIFSSLTQQAKGAQFWVINKGDMLQCSGAGYVTKTFSNYFSIHPVQSDTSTTTQYMVATSQTKQGSFVNLFSINGAPPNLVSFSVKNIKVSSIASPPSAVQKGSVFRLDTGDYRVQDAVWTNGILWLAHNNMCTPTGDTSARSCLHLVEIDTGTMSIKQDFDYGEAGKYVFYPALRQIPSSGNLVLVYGYSSSSNYPGIKITDQASSDPVKSFETPQVVQAGSGPVNLFFSCLSINGCRYGDYFGAGLDGNTNQVWVAGEYGSGVRSDIFDPGSTWATEIGDFEG